MLSRAAPIAFLRSLAFWAVLLDSEIVIHASMLVVPQIEVADLVQTRNILNSLFALSAKAFILARLTRIEIDALTLPNNHWAALDFFFERFFFRKRKTLAV